ncbi:hypothetical protein RJ639_005402 [Escallonia herrerae]|uniref:Uncharacterized protein n=1 Tax=Escallonia herrerae TaxID=1293975 RepID=A0AA89AUV6_9ASTE|nr:hypothetical protein RJ639_005402 [Escallonia herrerae]
MATSSPPQRSLKIVVHWMTRDMEAFLASDNDVVLLCSSILSLSEVVKSIPFRCLKRPTLFADVLSVKQHPREVLLQGCKMLEMTCEEHDKILSELEIEPTCIDTLGFKKLVQLETELMTQLQDLELALEKVKQNLRERMDQSAGPECS